MCGRAACTLAPSAIKKVLGVSKPWTNVSLYKPSYNVAPMMMQPVCAMQDGERVIKLLKWGVPGWGGREMINARSETLAEKRTFKRLLGNRAVAVVDGYYEWKKLKPVKGGKVQKQPYFFCRADGKPFLLPVIYDPTNGVDGCHVVLTVDAREDAARVHDRMPAIIDEADIDTWVNPDTPIQDVLKLLKTWEGSFDFYPVTRKVGNFRFDSPEAIVKLEQVSEDVPALDKGQKSVKGFFSASTAGPSLKGEVKREAKKPRLAKRDVPDRSTCALAAEARVKGNPSSPSISSPAKPSSGSKPGFSPSPVETPSPNRPPTQSPRKSASSHRSPSKSPRGPKQVSDPFAASRGALNRSHSGSGSDTSQPSAYSVDPPAPVRAKRRQPMVDLT